MKYSYFFGILTCCVLIACSDNDVSKLRKSLNDAEPDSAQVQVAVNTDDVPRVLDNQSNQNDESRHQETVSDSVYRDLPPLLKGDHKYADSAQACAAMRDFLHVEARNIRVENGVIHFTVAATNHAPFPILNSGGSINFINTQKNWPICDSVAWGVYKENGEPLQPGETVLQSTQFDKTHWCGSEEMKDGYRFNYIPSFLVLGDDTKITDQNFNCGWEE